MQQNSFSYPAMLDLKNKKCVIIGGGKVAVRKALPLIEAGADLTVIAPAADPQLLTLAKTGLLQLELRAYADNDLIDAFVTIAATDDFHINRKKRGFDIYSVYRRYARFDAGTVTGP